MLDRPKLPSNNGSNLDHMQWQNSKTRRIDFQTATQSIITGQRRNRPAEQTTKNIIGKIPTSHLGNKQIARC
jgi:hypothetical protein